MKKLKLLFPLLGTSALAVTPTLAAQTHQLHKNSNNYLSTAQPRTFKFKVKNFKYFLPNRVAPYARYSIPNSINRFTQAYYEVYLSKAGANALATYATKTIGTGANIMHWLNQYAPGFGSGDYQTGDYLSAIKWSQENMMGTIWAYNGFKDSMKQAASFLYKYAKDKSKSDIAISFNYTYHGVLPSNRGFQVAFGNY